MTKKHLLAVLGGDVSKSLSPRLHTAAAVQCGLDVAYVPVSCRDSRHFAEAIAALETLDARGCNVTIPFKDDARLIATERSEVAEQIGAVNTLTFEDGRRHGDNTDGPALVTVFGALLEDRGHIQILGAGGAARAAAWAAHRLGFHRVTVCARDLEAASAVAALAGGEAAPLSPIEGVDLVVSALPKAVADVAEAAIHVHSQPKVVDLAYGTVADPSPLARVMLDRGLVALDGRQMLIEQAALALAKWTGGEVSSIRSAMQRVLPHFDTHPGRT